jgi:hypothetical protein
MRKELLSAAIAMTFLAEMSFGMTRTIVPVCVDHVPMLGAAGAIHIAATLFQQAGVPTAWYDATQCPLSGYSVHISFDTKAEPNSFRPNAMAWSFPYDDENRIMVIVERVRVFAGTTLNGRIAEALAYVMAHETGHMLEGVARHSHRGIMKPGFEAQDGYQMLRHSLTFDQYDVALMNAGIARRSPASEPWAVAASELRRPQ